MKDLNAMRGIRFSFMTLWIAALGAALTIGCQQKEVRVEVPIVTLKTNTVFVTNNIVFTNNVVVTNTVTKTNTRVVTNIVTRIVNVTNELVREFPLVEEKIVHVKSPVPVEYTQAFGYAESVKNAKYISNDGTLKGLPGIKVAVFIQEALQSKLSKNAIKDKVELKLRQSGLKIDDDSPYWLAVDVEGFWEKDGIRANYSIEFRLLEEGTIIRSKAGTVFRTGVSTWKRSTHGFAGSSVLETSVMNTADGYSEAFANAFLAQNPK